MKKIEIDDEVYNLIVKMTEIMKETPAYIVYRAIWREFINNNEYHTHKKEVNNEI